jgi:hypothetical protein
MRFIKTFFIILIALNVSAQIKQPVRLQWKIAPNETLKYQTLMTDIDTSKIDFNFGSFINSFSDSSSNAKFEGSFSKLNKAMMDFNYITKLTNKGNDVIDIVVVMNPKEKKDSASSDSISDAYMKLMEQMNKGILLRGSVNATGGVHSFWMKSNQKNLVALLFQLPDHPVKIGDKWKLEVNLISNDQNFRGDKSEHINEVTLIDLKKVNNETVATLKYNIVEYVAGIFYNPVDNAKNAEVPTMMRLTHQAIATFSVDRGRWINYDAVSTITATGAMTANKKTEYRLIPN